MDFSKRVCFIVGGTSGIGRELIKILARNGCRVVFSYHRNHTLAIEIVEDNKRYSVEAVKVDATKIDEVCKTIDHILIKHNRINHIAVLSGHSDPEVWNSQWYNLDLETYIKVFSIDFGSFFNVAKCIYSRLDQSDLKSIVTITSTPALTGDTKGYPYLIAKASILAFSKSLARSLSPKVRVNSVALGSIETKWLNWLKPHEVEELKRSTLVKRLGTPKEAANVIAFLLSDDSSYINGQVVIVDGGEVIPT